MALIAAALLVGVTAGGVVASGHLPGFAVREVDQFPHAASRPRTETPNPQPGTAYGRHGYESVTLAEARARVQFRVLEPAVLPPVYQLRSVEVPTSLLDPHVRLIYESVADRSRELIISEAPTLSRQPERVAEFLRGTTEETVVDGLPAIYVRSLMTLQQESRPERFNDSSHALIVERSGVLVEVFGRRDAGVDRAMLERITASLH